METLLRAIICGVFAGIFSPICFLSAILGGGMAVGMEQKRKQQELTNKEILSIGLYCGFSAGLFSLVFWYGLLRQTTEFFSWFFSHSAGASLLKTSTPILWQYGLLHFFACIPLSVLGSFGSTMFQKR